MGWHSGRAVVGSASPAVPGSAGASGPAVGCSRVAVSAPRLDGCKNLKNHFSPCAFDPLWLLDHGKAEHLWRGMCSTLGGRKRHGGGMKNPRRV